MLNIWHAENKNSKWGILVKLVVCVSSGHLEIKIANFMQYLTFACSLPSNNALSPKNMMFNLREAILQKIP